MERKTSLHPAWALAFKRKGTELRLLKGTYYLYAISSRWDKEKKRSVKITAKLLGKITEQDGFLESDKARIARQQMKIAHLQVKEYGVTALIGSVFHDIVLALQQHFPDI